MIRSNNYYKGLSVELKARFVIRTIRFYRRIRFKSDANLKVSLSMKVLIASAFIQMTFGFKKYLLKKFTTILIAPSHYSYAHTDDYYHGDVNPGLKRVTLSWPAIKKGFEIPNDALNLCIHKFGHCILLEDKTSLFSRFLRKKQWSRYRLEADKKLAEIRASRNEVLRDYGGSNHMELFSVCLEAFFEQPERLSINEPNLYYAISLLMKQDPRNRRSPLLNTRL